jgi:hypothetical protein
MQKDENMPGEPAGDQKEDIAEKISPDPAEPPQTENMEVHHHPDLHHKKKNFREYFLEFIMIFLAVTLGFFAENLRESITNHEKENEYMRAMTEDITKDTTEINGEIRYASRIIAGLDSLFQCLHSTELTDSVQRRLYFLNAEYNRLVGVQFSDETSSQLKNAAEIRLIRNRQVADGISFYWKGILRLQEDASHFNNKMNEMGESGYTIFDRAFIRHYNRSKADSAGMIYIRISAGARLMTHETNQLVIYANRVIVLCQSLQNWYLPALEKQKKAANDLIHLIKEKYDFQ